MSSSSGSSDITGAESTHSTSVDSSSSSGHDGLPDCDPTAGCGDGLVTPGEACDDANDNDADGCTAACERPSPDVIATLAMGAEAFGAVDADGSVIVATESPPEVARFAPDGLELWRVSIAPSSVSVHLRSVVIGADVVIVGGVEESDWIATEWRVGADGQGSSSRSDPAFDSYQDVALTSDGGVVLLTEETVERRGPAGAVLWSRELELPSEGAVGSIALADDDVAFVAGGVSGGDECLIARVTPEETTITLLPDSFPGAFLKDVAPMSERGAVAVGSSDGFVVAVMVDAIGQVVSTSTCSTDGLGTAVETVAVIDQRILLAGSRNAEPGCIDVCGGYHTAWMQQLALDGTVIATDDPGVLGSSTRRPTEAVVAFGRSGAGEMTALVADWSGETSMLVRFPR
jgi:cysteine-rich repeat protein